MLIATSSTIPAACLYRHCYSIIVSADSLGEFAGVLTALTFTAIIFLAGLEKKDHPDVENTLILFVAAFVSMATSTYLFTSAAAEELPSSREAFEAFAASLAFTAALLPLFLGIAQLMRDRGFRRVERFASRLANWVIGLLGFLFMSLTAVSANGINESTASAWNSTLGIGCGVLLLLLFIWVALGQRALRFKSRTGIDRWTVFTVAIVVVAIVLTAIWDERSARAAMPSIGYVLLMLLLFAATLGYSSALKSLERKASIAPPGKSQVVGSGVTQFVVVVGGSGGVELADLSASDSTLPRSKPITPH